MTTPNPTPHDSFAQEVFSDPEQAAVVLRAVLPPVLTSALDFSKAKLLPSLFKDEELKERRADFLFEIPLAGKPALVLTLLEHQSRQDRTMAARLLVYAGRALDGHLRKHPRAKRLPALIPVVLYHGKREWTAPRELFELYALDPPLREALRGHLPNLRFFLDDLSQVGDDDLRQRPGPVLARLALIVLRHAERLRKAKDPAATLRSLAASLSDLLQQARDRAGLVVVFRYMLEVVELEPEEGQAILARALPARVKEDVVTAADQLRAQGEVRAMRRVLLRLLHAKFKPVPPEVENRVATAGATELETWTDRVINASSLDEVFADPA
ncbi:MAG: Rpn family recombination-promoting nuclease/putative transposase [Planctomycetes bacterium]|nr:Rpn family recombination-promoting nuclease/putative transposase [Planctomycetota bacterium]